MRSQTEGGRGEMKGWKPGRSQPEQLLVTCYLPARAETRGVADVEEGGKLSVSLLIVSQKTEPSAESDTPGILADFMST